MKRTENANPTMRDQAADPVYQANANRAAMLSAAGGQAGSGMALASLLKGAQAMSEGEDADMLALKPDSVDTKMRAWMAPRIQRVNKAMPRPAVPPVVPPKTAPVARPAAPVVPVPKPQMPMQRQMTPSVIPTH